VTLEERSPGRLLLATVLLLVNVGVYGQVVTFDFVSLDDDVYVTKNAVVRSGLTLHGIAWAFTTNHAANWHPLTWLSLMLDSTLGGARPAVYHFTNLILHSVNTLLLFLAFDRMSGCAGRSAFVAALFAVHPLHVESVAWISERKDVLSTFFWFLALLTYHRFTRAPSGRRLLGTIFLVALGLMSKPTLVTVPLLLLLLDFWPLGRRSGDGRREWGALAREKAPFFLLSIAASVVTWIAQSGGGAFDAMPALSLGSRVSNAIVTPVAYAFRMVWPSRLAVFYPHPGGSLPTIMVVSSALVLGAITTVALLAARRRPFVTVGWLWYLVALLPMLGVVQVGRQSMADRYSYVPLIGLFVVVAWGATDLLSMLGSLGERTRRVILGTAAASTVGVLAGAAYNQAGTWRNSRTLFQHAVAARSGNYLAEAALGSEIARAGAPEEALSHFREALRVEPSFVEARDALARVLLALGRTEEAVAEWNEVLREKPDYAEARANLAAARIVEGRTEDAVAESLRALRDAPDLPVARTNLGLVLLRGGRLEEAAAEFRRALAADPDHAAAHTYLAGILLRNGSTEEAKAHCRAALRVDPDASGAHHNLGLAFLEEGRLEDALEEFEAAIRAEPRYVDSRLNLGVVLARLGRMDEAAARFSEVLRIDPQNQAARRNLELVTGPRRHSSPVP